MRKTVLRVLGILITFATLASGKNDFVNVSRNNTDKRRVIYMSSRILNGTEAVLGQFPQQVALGKIKVGGSSFHCGGSIIDQKWIVTAAHCIADPDNFLVNLEPEQIKILAGEVELKSRKSDNTVSKIIIHPDYKRYSTQNDIALLQLERPFSFNKYINSIPLAQEEKESDVFCQVTGWGTDSNVAALSRPRYPLRYVDIPLVNRSICANWLKKVFPKVKIEKSQLCAGYEQGQRDSCDGDSGGGLVCKGFLTGVTSASVHKSCGLPRMPGIYTNVFYFKQWILMHINGTDETDDTTDAASSPSAQNPFTIFSISFMIYIFNIFTVD